MCIYATKPSFQRGLLSSLPVLAGLAGTPLLKEVRAERDIVCILAPRRRWGAHPEGRGLPLGCLTRTISPRRGALVARSWA